MLRVLVAWRWKMWEVTRHALRATVRVGRAVQVEVVVVRAVRPKTIRRLVRELLLGLQRRDWRY